MDFIPFNSRDTFYKSKFGAVKTGEKFRLRLILPRSFSATAAYFMLRRDDGDFCEHKMCWAGMNGDMGYRAGGSRMRTLLVSF